MRVKESPRSESLRAAWSMLVPPVWEKGGRGVDLRVQWNGNDNDEVEGGASNSNSNSPTLGAGVPATAVTPTSTAAARAATTLLHELQHQRQHQLPTNLNPQEKDQMKEALVESMQLFQDFCRDHLKDGHHFQVRVTSSRGSAGTKCPVWHMDHVPVRWIQSLVGPGCMWVDQEDAATAVERWNNKVDSDNDGDEWMAQSVKERNHQLIGPTATIHQAAQGEAVMLIGNRWAELAVQSQSDGSASPTAAIHKSPDQLLPFQGRVLLTMDVLYD